MIFRDSCSSDFLEHLDVLDVLDILDIPDILDMAKFIQSSSSRKSSQSSMTLVFALSFQLSAFSSAIAAGLHEAFLLHQGDGHIQFVAGQRHDAAFQRLLKRRFVVDAPTVDFDAHVVEGLNFFLDDF